MDLIRGLPSDALGSIFRSSPRNLLNCTGSRSRWWDATLPKWNATRVALVRQRPRRRWAVRSHCGKAGNELDTRRSSQGRFAIGQTQQDTPNFRRKRPPGAF